MYFPNKRGLYISSNPRGQDFRIARTPAFNRSNNYKGTGGHGQGKPSFFKGKTRYFNRQEKRERKNAKEDKKSLVLHFGPFNNSLNFRHIARFYTSLVLHRHRRSFPFFRKVGRPSMFIKKILRKVTSLRFSGSKKFTQALRSVNSVCQSISNPAYLRTKNKQFRIFGIGHMLNYRSWLSSVFYSSFNFAPFLNKISTVFWPVHNLKRVTAATLLVYSIRKLRNYYTPREVFPNLLRSARNYGRYTTVDDIRGLLVICSGRITKKQMASQHRFQLGSASKGTVKSPLDYAQGSLSLKYGAIGVKIYLTHNT